MQCGLACFGAEHDVQLLQDDDDADPGKHRMHHHWRDGEGNPPHLGHSKQYLEDTGSHGDGAGDGPAELLNEAGDDDRQSGGRPADLQRGATQAACHDAADRGRDQPGHDRRARRSRDAE